MVPYAHILLSAALALSLNFVPVTAQASQAEADFLQHAAEQYILAQFTDLPPDVRLNVSASPINPNKDYGGKCEGYLTAELQGNTIRQNNSVKIVCASPDHPFTVFIPVKVERLIATLTAARDLSRDTLLTAADINESFVPDVRQNSYGITRKDLLIGSRLKRDLRAGNVFAPGSFCVVCKGDKVQLEAHKGGLSLKTTGVALEDGSIGENIRVQNARSKKTVLGRVASHDTVVIDF